MIFEGIIHLRNSTAGLYHYDSRQGFFLDTKKWTFDQQEANNSKIVGIVGKTLSHNDDIQTETLPSKRHFIYRII
jgi:hypothetical protein